MWTLKHTCRVPYAIQGNIFTGIMVNFMCQLDCVKGDPESWLKKMICGCVREVVSRRDYIWISTMSKEDHAPQRGRAASNPLWAHIEQEGREGADSLSLSWGSHLLPLDTGAPGSQVFRLGLNYTTGFPVSSARRWQIVGFLIFHNQFL